MKLSVVMIVRDEEELLPRCLDSLEGLWDELVVVDTGSTDRTPLIAQQYGATVHQWPWRDDFAAARNHAESLCTGDYIYWQDADEILTAGKDAIREIVDAGEEVAVRPTMVFERDEYGEPSLTYQRQDLLHKRGSHVWKGKVHEWTEGPGGRVEKRILVEQLSRSGGDRPHGKNGDVFGPLLDNLNEQPCERHLFYLAREHVYAGNWTLAVAVIDHLLAQPVEWPVQRSSACILKGRALRELGKPVEARAAFLQAMQEWGAWADPYYALGELHYSLGQWTEGAAWLQASLFFDPPADYFTDQTVYRWRRYDLLAVCLHRLGRNEEARRYGEIAAAARPDDERLRDNLRWYGAA